MSCKHFCYFSLYAYLDVCQSWSHRLAAHALSPSLLVIFLSVFRSERNLLLVFVFSTLALCLAFAFALLSVSRRRRRILSRILLHPV